MDANTVSTAAIYAAPRVAVVREIRLPARLVTEEPVLTVNGWPADQEEAA